MSAQAVASTAMCKCSFGDAPTPLNATSCIPSVMIENKPAATIMDFAPAVNIIPFGTCKAPTMMGMPPPGTPKPCVPAPTGPWIPGQPKVIIKGRPALTNSCKLICAMGGIITITNAGTTHTQC